MPKSTLSLAAARRLSIRTQSPDHLATVQSGKERRRPGRRAPLGVATRALRSVR